MRGGDSLQTATAKASRPGRLCRSSLPGRDEKLLAAYAETGNREAFEELVRRYEREMFGYLRNFLGDAQLAEDAFQNTFLQLHRKCHQFQPGRPLRSWLYAIANHQAVDLLRRNRRHKAISLSTAAGTGGADDYGQPLVAQLATEGGHAMPDVETMEDRQRTRMAVEMIPGKLRQVLTLIVYRDFTYREAAAALGISLGTVKNRMHQALQSVRAALIPTEAESFPKRRRPHMLCEVRP
jgi:RNA polymerase sigma-70 factor (ECF subfamily)